MGTGNKPAIDAVEYKIYLAYPRYRKNLKLVI